MDIERGELKTLDPSSTFDDSSHKLDVELATGLSHVDMHLSCVPIRLGFPRLSASQGHASPSSFVNTLDGQLQT